MFSRIVPIAFAAFFVSAHCLTATTITARFQLRPYSWDTCAGLTNVGECTVNATISNPTAKFQFFTDNADLAASADATGSTLNLRSTLNQGSASHIGSDLFIFADYVVEGTLNVNSNIMQLHPELAGTAIPTIDIDMKDNGSAAHGFTLPDQDSGVNIVQSYYTYTRILNVDYFSPTSGSSYVSSTNQGETQIPSTDPISNNGTVQFENNVPVFMPHVGNFQIGIHVSVQLSGDTYGGGYVDLAFGQTTAITGIKLLTADGTDVTSAIDFSLDDGTPLFNANDAVPEPQTLAVVPGGILAFWYARRRRA